VSGSPATLRHIGWRDGIPECLIMPSGVYALGCLCPGVFMPWGAPGGRGDKDVLANGKFKSRSLAAAPNSAIMGPAATITGNKWDSSDGLRPFCDTLTADSAASSRL